VKIDIHQQLFISRRQLAGLGLVSRGKRFAIKVASTVLRRPWLYGFAGGLARLVLRIMPRALVYSRLNVWGRQRELPKPPRETFRELYRRRK